MNQETKGKEPRTGRTEVAALMKTGRCAHVLMGSRALAELKVIENTAVPLSEVTVNQYKHATTIYRSRSPHHTQLYHSVCVYFDKHQPDAKQPLES